MNPYRTVDYATAGLSVAMNEDPWTEAQSHQSELHPLPKVIMRDNEVWILEDSGQYWKVTSDGVLTHDITSAVRGLPQREPPWAPYEVPSESWRPW